MIDERPGAWLGKPTTRGVSWDGRGVNFALSSRSAVCVDLRPFDSRGRRDRSQIDQCDQELDLFGEPFLAGVASARRAA